MIVKINDITLDIQGEVDSVEVVDKHITITTKKPCYINWLPGQVCPLYLTYTPTYTVTCSTTTVNEKG